MAWMTGFVARMNRRKGFYIKLGIVIMGKNPKEIRNVCEAIFFECFHDLVAILQGFLSRIQQ